MGVVAFSCFDFHHRYGAHSALQEHTGEFYIRMMIVRDNVEQ